MILHRLTIVILLIISHSFGCSDAFGQPLTDRAPEVFLHISPSLAGTWADGSQQHPYPTIEAAIEAAPRYATLLLHSGERFEVTRSINLHSKRLSIDSYGQGSLPVLSGFRTIRFSAGNLTHTPGSALWRLVLNDELCHNAGFLYNRQADAIAFGRRVRSIERHDASQSYLCREGDFCQHADTLWLYHAADQWPYPELEVACGLSCFEFLKECTVQNVRVEGFGRHGFSGISVNATIRNVEVDLIGGSLHDASGRTFARLGNGIEVWIASGDPETSRPHDVLVEGCHVSRTYDAGCTLQGAIQSGSRQDPGAWNIVFTHNTIERCRQSYECFVRQYNDQGVQLNSNYPVSNCRFEHNDCYDAGQNGFGSPEHRDCHLYGGTEGMLIGHNRFSRGGFLFRFAMDQGQCFTFLPGNVCRLRRGDTLLRTYNPRTSRYEDNALAGDDFTQQLRLYRQRLADDETEFLFEEEEGQALRTVRAHP